MERYIAFLRGINVSGHKIIKMEVLRKAFAEAGFTDVKTYIQSGNILFNSDEQNTEVLIINIEDLVEKEFGFRTDVILRRRAEIESILNTLRLTQRESGDDQKYYITFLKEEYPQLLPVPVYSKNQDIGIIYHNSKDFISISAMFKGIYGFPNALIEKTTGIPATTRNPQTLDKILAL
jgi:uncharacterized protein (DUF1697 family)